MSKFTSFKKNQLIFENWRVYSENCGCPDRRLSEFRDEGGLDLPREGDDPPEDLEEKIKNFITNTLLPSEDIISDKQELKDYVIEVMPEKIDMFLEQELLASEELRPVVLFRYQASDEGTRIDLEKLYEDIIQTAEFMQEYDQDEDFSYWIKASKHYLEGYGWPTTDKIEDTITEQDEGTIDLAAKLGGLLSMVQNNPEAKQEIENMLMQLQLKEKKK
tara:strand:+ start:306 stop:959 length:654 start_codon:yes stop_codon:yes gene_type:complete